jgi:hypothetical protein
MTESKGPVVYEPSTDTMAIEIHPWPGGEGEKYGGEDAGPDLVIHYAPDGAPWLYEIEHASEHPEHIAAALREMRSQQSKPKPQLHTINDFKLFAPGDARLLLNFDDDDRGRLTHQVDLSPLLARGGVFEPLRDPNRFMAVEIAPRGRSLVWHVGEDVVDLSADALWQMAHPDAD